MIDEDNVSKTLNAIISLIKEEDSFYLIDTNNEENNEGFENYIHLCSGYVGLGNIPQSLHRRCLWVDRTLFHI